MMNNYSKGFFKNPRILGCQEDNDPWSWVSTTRPAPESSRLRTQVVMNPRWKVNSNNGRLCGDLLSPWGAKKELKWWAGCSLAWCLREYKEIRKLGGFPQGFWLGNWQPACFCTVGPVVETDVNATTCGIPSELAKKNKNTSHKAQWPEEK